MGVASLVLGIFAVILAAMCTAPCFSCLAFIGVPIAIAGSTLGVAEGVQSIRGYYKGQTEFPNLRHGAAGFVLNTTSLAWSLLMLLMKGGAL